MLILWASYIMTDQYFSHFLIMNHDTFQFSILRFQGFQSINITNPFLCFLQDSLPLRMGINTYTIKILSSVYACSFSQPGSMPVLLMRALCSSRLIFDEARTQALYVHSLSSCLHPSPWLCLISCVFALSRRP